MHIQGLKPPACISKGQGLVGKPAFSYAGVMGDAQRMNETSSDFKPWVITVNFEPGGKTKTLPRPRTVTQLLNRLNLKAGGVLVIRDGGLLTPDREILPDDVITLRSVVSSG